MAIRILIVDKHEIVRMSLALCLSSFDDLILVGEAEDGASGLALCAQLQPNLVITEIRLPKVDGVTLTSTITQTHPQIKVIALDTTLQDNEIEVILQAGAYQYISKDVSIDVLADAIRAANGTVCPSARC